MKLSEHLELAEMLRSESAKRLGLKNTPTPEHLEAMKLLAEHIFEPIRANFRCPILISSGYRSAELNKHIKGSSMTSQHSKGEAIDIDMDNTQYGVSNSDIFNFIKTKLPFDQLIWEYGDNENPDWVHVSYSAKGKQRGEILKCTRISGKPHYEKLKN